MMTNEINRFCFIVAEINRLNEILDKEKANYYDGGYTFEECHSIQINELKVAQEECQELLRLLTI